MSKAKQWLAVVQDERWTLAKVRKRQRELHILRLSELDLAESSLSSEEIGQESEDGRSARSRRLREWLLREKVPLKKLKIAVSYLGVITRL